MSRDDAQSGTGGLPLVIVGAGRSGTNMLRDCLAQLDGVVTWPCDEINYIWRHGNREETTDEFTAAHARPPVQAFIRSRFTDIARRATAADRSRREGPIIVEKTCANSLRVPFVDAVLPEARYLYIVRDGRDVVASAGKRWKAPLDIPYLLAKARYVPVSDLPYYATRYALNRLRKLRSSDATLSVWGPRFEGMQALAETASNEAVCAAQWSRCVERSDAAFESIAPERVLRARYEDFVSSPAEHMMRIGEFVGRPFSPDAIAAATANVRVSSVGKGGRELPPDVVSRMAEMLTRYGYS